MRNPFRRQTETAAPSLRDRATDLSARLASTIRKPEPAAAPTAEPEDTVSLEGAASLDFPAYALDDPLNTPTEWANRFNSPAMAMHVADRTLRMTKPELIAFIRKAGETDAATPEIMFRNLDASQETLEGWGKLLSVARTRYLVAAAAACLEPDAESEATAEPATGATEPAAPVEDTFPPTPTDLADACLWAIRHRDWSDRVSSVQDWSDERGDAELDRTSAVFTRAINEPSTNLREITAKAALALNDFELFTLRPGHKPDDGTRIVHTVLREVVGVGREAGAPSLLTHHGSLSAAILDAWAAWRATTLGDGQEEAPENLAAWEQTSAEMNRLCDLAADLPATSENITAKALAAAWGGWAYAERPRQPRAHYPTDERCLFDINAAIMARGTLGSRHYNELPETILLPMVDFTGASMIELWDIFKAAGLICDIASTATDNRHGRAGKLSRWVSDALCAVISEAVLEAQRRTPSDDKDRATRLAIICATTIDSGDKAEAVAFARELLAMAEQ